MEKFEGKVICKGMTLGPIYIHKKESFKVIHSNVDEPEKEIERVKRIFKLYKFPRIQFT